MILRWVLLFDLAAATWLAVRRRLTAAAIMVLFGQTILLWFAVSQYYLKFLGFHRAGTYSPLVMLLLALMMLWLLYRAGLYRAIGSSPLWPLTGRIGIYSAIMLFVLLEIHCRAAIHDGLAIDRIFLYTFRGIIDFGLPYMLAVYASRRLKTLPLSTPHMIGAFGLGAAVALTLNALDKLVAAGGSLRVLAADLETRFDMVLTDRIDVLAQLAPDFPLGWTLTRGLLAIAALVAVAVIIGRRVRDRENPEAVVALRADRDGRRDGRVLTDSARRSDHLTAVGSADPSLPGLHGDRRPHRCTLSLLHAAGDDPRSVHDPLCRPEPTAHDCRNISGRGTASGGDRPVAGP